MDTKFNADVIVVGAGPSGISAALSVAKSNKKVILVERASYPGSKNMYGGAVYTTALKEVFGDDFDKFKYERIINSHTWSFLNDTGSFEMTYKNNDAKAAYAIKRFQLESQMIEIAKANGVYYIPNTLVTNLIQENGSVVGIQTEQEKYYAPITILADGVNSLLARELKLRNDYKTHDIILSVKEAIKLDKKTIETRFNLKDDLSNGVNKQFFGSDFGKLKQYKNLFMMTFLYTFKDTIMLGVGVNLADLSKNKLNINEILDEIKLHPDIAPLIKDGQTVEYSAHLIPEGGYKKIPKLTSNGVIITGDAAGFVNGVHFEGTNFALISGKLAGESALVALENGDYSQNTLSVYIKKLEKSFILKDLYSYRNVIESLYSRSDSLSRYYPKKIKELFEIVTSANCISKSKQIKEYFFSYFKDRNIIEVFKDVNAALKCVLDVFFGK
ncbi:MAG: FAD-dependent oxidoreductase [Candidatus Gastranaerophilales bacterium]|nr:FAD-dependent oxidoreductase [Candidatus Gastranaerophilales bacterium]